MEKTITITEKQLTEAMADVTYDMMTDKKTKDSPTAGVAVMMLGAILNAKVCRKLFHGDEKEETEEVDAETLLMNRVNGDDPLH